MTVSAILKRENFTCPDCDHEGIAYTVRVDDRVEVRTIHKCGVPRELQALQKVVV